MKSTPRALGALLCAIAAVAASSAKLAAAEENDTADACVGFQRDVGDKQIAIHAANACQRRLACTLDYSVRCEDNDGKVTSRAARHVPFALGAQGSAELTLSASACKQGWAIDDLVWSCR